MLLLTVICICDCILLYYRRFVRILRAVLFLAQSLFFQHRTPACDRRWLGIALFANAQCVLYFSVTPSAILKPLSSSSSSKSPFGQCFSVSWSLDDGCGFVAGGYASGHVALWDVSTKSTFLKSEDRRGELWSGWSLMRGLWWPDRIRDDPIVSEVTRLWLTKRVFFEGLLGNFPTVSQNTVEPCCIDHHQITLKRRFTNILIFR